MKARLKHYTYTPFTGLYMARSAFTGGLFPTLLNHVGPLQDAWGNWGALIRLHGVSGCCQRLSRPTRSTVAVSVPYWGHAAAVCLLVDGITRLRLPTRPHRPSDHTPPPSRPPTHPSPLPPTPINSIRDITAVGKKLSKPSSIS